MTACRVVLLLLIFCSWSLSGISQEKTKNPWSFTKNKENNRPSNQIPEKYKTVQLEETVMEDILSKAPLRFSQEAAVDQVLLTIPLANGTTQQFSIVEAPVLHPDLGKRFPTIKSYAGQGLDDPSAIIRFDWSPHGFHGIILSSQQPTVIIDRYTKNSDSDYYVFYKKDRVATTALACSLKRGKTALTPSSSTTRNKAGDCQLRTYRLALACTGEYAQYHGGTTADALAAMNTTLTRINGVFENELSISLQIINQNTEVIFLNGSTDPYDNFDGGEMLDQNQRTIDERIGAANYDIGHVFSTGGGGVAGLGVACSFRSKAEGVTGSDEPEGDFFDIDFVAHELGHQFGAEHTFSGSRDACAGNSWEPSAVEPGGGSTIMAYAGICGSQDIQNQSDVYFHAQSIEEISNFITGEGDSCPQKRALDNEAPVVDAGLDYSIPRSTPFVLKGTSMDADNDVLSYTWEQMDSQLSSQPPEADNSGGPMFRSLPPTSSLERYLPDLRFLSRNLDNRWEVLPSIARQLNFRFTARDNSVNGGCTAEDDMRISVIGTAGPFLVRTPNSSVKWIGGSNELIEWDVANTTEAPINAALVDILLSTDGGFTFTEILAERVPNTGMAEVTVPNLTTSDARVMVRASDNIFFDMSNSDFTIEPILDNFFLTIAQTNQQTCSQQAAIYPIDVKVSGSLDGMVKLATTGLPDGVGSSFSKNDFSPPASTELSITTDGRVTAGTYEFTLTVEGSTGIQTKNLTLTIVDESATLVLSAPANNETAVSPSPNLSWMALPGVETYNVEIADNPSFNEPIVYTMISGNTFDVPEALSLNSRYYWRVVPNGACQIDAASAVFSFVTSNIACTVFDSEAVPLEISSTGTPTIFSTLEVPVTGVITDVNVLNLQIDHSFVSDLSIALISPEESLATLLLFPCLFEENVDINFDDEANNVHGTIPCPPIGGGTYQPREELSTFIGEAANGTWQLVVNDDADDDGGSLNSWSLEVCYLQESISAALAATIEQTNESCAGANDGTATVNAIDGSGTYTYAWSNGATTEAVTDLSAGS